MDTVATPTAAPFEQVVDALVELQELEADQAADTPAADDLRERMAVVWLSLSPDEMDVARGISADLFMLSDEEIRPEVPGELRPEDKFRTAYEQAKGRRDYRRILELLRYRPEFLDRGALAFLRGRAYEELGLPQVAAAFYDYAWRLTDNPYYGLLTVVSWLAAGRGDRALRDAKETLLNRGLPFPALPSASPSA